MSSLLFTSLISVEMKGAPLSVKICGNPTKLKIVCMSSTTVTASPLLIGIASGNLVAISIMVILALMGSGPTMSKAILWNGVVMTGGIPRELFLSCLSSLSGIPHRLEPSSSHPWSFLASYNVAAIIPMSSFSLSVLTMLTCVAF